MNLPDLRPRPGEVRDIVRRARVRKAAKASMASGFTGLAVLAAVVAPSLGTALGAHEDDTVIATTPSPALPSPLPTGLPDLGLFPSESASPDPGASAAEPAPPPDDPNAPVGDPAPHPSVPTDDSPSKPEMIRRTADQPLACDPTLGGYTAGPSSTCYTGSVMDSGGYYTLTITLCRAHDASNDLTLSFPDGIEADFVVSDDSPVWTWSKGGPYDPAAHTLAMQPASCFEWSVPWTLTDEAGNDVPDGRYLMTGRFAATELAGLSYRFAFTKGNSA